MNSFIVVDSPKLLALLLAVASAGCQSTAGITVAGPPAPKRIAPNLLSAQTAQALERAERDPYWIEAREAVDQEPEALLVQHLSEKKRQEPTARLLRGDTARKWVAITFDDGPHPAYTPRILEILDRYRAKATFFLVGEMAERHPDLVRAEQTAGHSIGNHTYHHVSLPKVPSDYVETEIKACDEVLRSILGMSPHLFRPPGGDYTPAIARTVAALDYDLILWSDDPGDYQSPGDSVIFNRTLERVGNGEIILIHDGIQETVDVLPALLEKLTERGYSLVTIDEMLANRADDAANRSTPPTKAVTWGGSRYP